MNHKKNIFIGIVLSLSVLISPLSIFADTAPSQQSLSSMTVQNRSAIPAPPELNLKAYILLDANTNTVLIEKNSNVHLPPASLTKLMTLYITASDLKNGQIHKTDQVAISEHAWRMEGSRMFIKVGSTIPMEQLINGVVIASGNDAAVAIAEFIGGNEDSFVKLMNQKAKDLGMMNTNFADSNGLPAANHYSSAYDLASLARAWIFNLPEYYPWFAQKWITYNGIKQPNRNRLLWRDPSVDGMKTGHTDEAGYCFVGSSVRNGMRLIVVLMGAPSDSARFSDAEALLNYGYRYFESHKIYARGTSLAQRRVWFGKDKILSLGLSRDLYVTTQVGAYQNLKANLIVNKNLKAPITKGQALGEIDVVQDGKVISTEKLVALSDIPRAGFFGSLFDHIVWFFHEIF